MAASIVKSGSHPSDLTTNGVANGNGTAAAAAVPAAPITHHYATHGRGGHGHHGVSPGASPRASILIGGLPSIATDMKCGVCFDMYRRPVRLQCDHSVCMDCAEYLSAYSQLKQGLHRDDAQTESKLEEHINEAEQAAAAAAEAAAAAPALRHRRTTSITLTTPTLSTKLLTQWLTVAAPPSLSVTCPVCEAVTPLTSEGAKRLPADDNLRRAVEKFAKVVGNPKHPRCMNECGVDAYLDCQTCEAVFCSKCHSSAAFSRHRTTPLVAVIPAAVAAAAAAGVIISGPSAGIASSSASSACLRPLRYCSVLGHADQQLMFYCFPCDKLCCVACASAPDGLHQEHEYVPLFEYAQQCRDEAPAGLVALQHRLDAFTKGHRIIDGRMRELDEIQAEIERHVAQSSADIIAAVKKREKELVDLARTIHRARREKMSVQTTVFNRAPGILAELVRQLRTVPEATDPVVAVAICQHVKQALKHFLVDDDMSIPCQGSGLLHDFSFARVQTALNEWGQIEAADLPGKVTPPPTLVLATPRNLRLQWSAPPGVAVQSFNLQMAPAGSLESEFRTIYSGPLPECEVGGLGASEQYSFRVQAVNNIGRGPWSDGVTFTTSRAASTGKEFKYATDFDTNGVLYWMGTARGTKRWSNPANAGHINVTRSSDWAGTAEEAAGRAATNCYTANLPNSWWAFDLKTVRVQPSHYTLRHGTAISYALRHWEFQGSDDPSRGWTTLAWHCNDKRLQATPDLDATTSSAATWSVPHATTAYRCFRILQTGPNSGSDEYPSEGNYLMLSGFEIYGSIEII